MLARKALAGTVAATVAKHGTGALNVDASRIATEGGSPAAVRRATSTAPSEIRERRTADDRPIVDRTSPERYREARDGEAIGRWPPNLVLSHAPECVEGGACAEDCAVAEMDRQSGTLTSGDRAAGCYERVGYHGDKGGPMPEIVGDSGGASRFFPVFRYEAKPARSERGRENVHPTVKPIALMAWLVQLVTPKGGVVLDPFLGSGTTAIACARLGIDCIGIEREAEYVEIARARIRGDAPLFTGGL